MTQKVGEGNRFSALRALRAERDQHEENEALQEPLSPEEEASPSIPTEEQNSSKKKTAIKRQSTKKKEEEATPEVEGKRGEKERKVGRPRGRSSDPNYTQTLVLIPLDLLIGVQDALAEERRASHQRKARPVSDLVEELLTDWLEKRNRDKSKS